MKRSNSRTVRCANFKSKLLLWLTESENHAISTLSPAKGLRKFEKEHPECQNIRPIAFDDYLRRFNRGMRAKTTITRTKRKIHHNTNKLPIISSASPLLVPVESLQKRNVELKSNVALYDANGHFIGIHDATTDDQLIRMKIQIGKIETELLVDPKNLFAKMQLQTI